MEEKNFERIYHQKRILTIIGICGVITKKAVCLIGVSSNGRKQQIDDMMKKGWIKKKQLSFSYYCRKRKEAKKETVYTLWNIKNRYDEYEYLIPFSESQLIKSHQWSMQKGMYFRIMRQSEILVMMEGAWISITGEDGAKYVVATDIKKWMEENLETTFDKLRTTLSRAYGAMLSWDNNLYVIYDFWYKDYLELNYKSENQFLNAAKEYLYKDKAPERNRRIAFIKSYEKIDGILDKRAGYQRFKKGVAFLSDGLYDETLLIPKSQEGKKILFIITQENAKEELDAYVGIPKERSWNIVCDGMEENVDGNCFHLNFLYPDADKLSLFLQSVQNSDTEWNRYIIHAYDCAAETIQKLHPGLRVKSYDLDTLFSMMFMKQVDF